MIINPVVFMFEIFSKFVNRLAHTMIRCINIDWLEVFCYEDTKLYPLTADFFEKDGWLVKQREYGTRIYGEMFSLCDKFGVPFIEIRRKPLSDKTKDGGIFDERACHIRFTNYYCYHNRPIDLLREFLNRYRYTLVRIFRIDICNDFATFDKGDDPSKFIQRYMSGRYSKVNQSNISAHGVDRWDGREWQSISWGKPKSMISTKFYCKTIELKAVKDKPYIRQAWLYAGLIDNPFTGEKRHPDGTITTPNIWRVEFSIKSSAKKWYLIESSDTRKSNHIAMPHTLDIYDTKEKLERVFASLCRHYFRFKIFEDGVRKDRCKDKILFDFRNMSQYYKVDRLASHEPSTNKLQRLINALLRYQEKCIDIDTCKAIDKIVKTLRHSQANEYRGVEMQPEDIIILQQVISMRMQGKNDTDIETHLKAVAQILASSKDALF